MVTGQLMIGGDEDVMFGKLLASMNIDGMIVDTVLEKKELRQGERVGGQLRLVGGNSEQEIKSAILTLVCEYRYDYKKSVKHSWKQVKIEPIGKIKPREEKVIPFQLEVPETMPCTFHRYYREGFRSSLITDLDIAYTIDPQDDDEVTILPHRDLQLLLDLLNKWEIEVTKMSGPMVPFGLFEFAFPYRQTISLRSAEPIPALVQLVYQGNGEIQFSIGRNSRLIRITSSDYQDSGERLKTLLWKLMGFSERNLVRTVINRLGIHRDPEHYDRYVIPEPFRSYCSEFSIRFLWENRFQIEWDQKRQGLKSLVDDMPDLDESKVHFQVTEQDLRDQGQRIEAMLIESFEKRKGTKINE
jgi:sporulation-control protein spo0M